MKAGPHTKVRALCDCKLGRHHSLSASRCTTTTRGWASLAMALRRLESDVRHPSAAITEQLLVREREPGSQLETHEMREGLFDGSPSSPSKLGAHSKTAAGRPCAMPIASALP